MKYLGNIRCTVYVSVMIVGEGWIGLFFRLVKDCIASPRGSE